VFRLAMILMIFYRLSFIHTYLLHLWHTSSILQHHIPQHGQKKKKTKYVSQFNVLVLVSEVLSDYP
jgi:hypothetical protein